MDSENASLTNTGNYTASGMPQDPKRWKPLRNCAFVVKKDIFTLACLRHVLQSGNMTVQTHDQQTNHMQM